MHDECLRRDLAEQFLVGRIGAESLARGGEDLCEVLRGRVGVAEDLGPSELVESRLIDRLGISYPIARINPPTSVAMSDTVLSWTTGRHRARLRRPVRAVSRRTTGQRCDCRPSPASVCPSLWISQSPVYNLMWPWRGGVRVHREAHVGAALAGSLNAWHFGRFPRTPIPTRSVSWWSAGGR